MKTIKSIWEKHSITILILLAILVLIGLVFLMGGKSFPFMFGI